ncbi:MAG TPA: ornithine cyclodeaminase family protein [Chloroflexota bacterium]|nr:ornithine cyclodeaminase family protein [Chloroflexota bacterium]
MAIFLDETQVAELLDMDSCIAALEDAFRDKAVGAAAIQPRRRLPFQRRRFHLMAASLMEKGYLGFKAYGASRGQDVVLYKAGEGMVAFLRSGRLGQVRTGAASGVATKYMARPNASRLGCIGTGHQAETQILAVAQVRKLESIAVYSRDAQRRRAFAEKMTAILEQEVRPVESSSEAVRGRDIVITMTNAAEPVFDGNLLEPGTHVNAAGGNVRINRELDEIAVTRAGTIAVDDREAAMLESGDLAWPVERGLLSWDKVWELGPIVAGLMPGRRSDDEITLFESQGIALEDVAAAAIVYERARERGVGAPLPF